MFKVGALIMPGLPGILTLVGPGLFYGTPVPTCGEALGGLFLVFDGVSDGRHLKCFGGKCDDTYERATPRDFKRQVIS